MNRYISFTTIFVGCLIFGLTSQSFGQSVTFDKSQFETNREGFKLANSKLKEGDSNFDKTLYTLALDAYLLAQNFNPNNAELNYKIGICYYETSSKFKCLDYFKKAYELDRQVATDIHLMLGRGFHLNQDFKNAIIEYKAYLAAIEEAEKEEMTPAINKYVNECYNGIEYLTAPPKAFMENMGVTINTTYNEHSPLITADESVLVFTSTRENNKKPDEDGQFDEDIYVSQVQGKQWTFPNTIGEPINTQFNDATVGLSPDGQMLLIYNGNRGNGDIEICAFEGDQWNYPRPLPAEINTEFRETSACFSPDGNHLYFVSDRPEGFGGSDIYVSTKNKKGKWEKAKNLGPIINTEFNEETVFMHPDGRTLYFSSEGHRSMGGFDIFTSQRNETTGTWEEPENLGFPVNSPDDDLCFVLSANGRHGYSSNIRSDSHGGYDIYKMTFLGPEKPLMLSNEDYLIAVRANPVSQMAMEENVTLKTIRLTIVKGLVTDGLTNNPVAAQIDIVDNEKNEVIFTSHTNSTTGNFLVSLPSGKNYGLIVKSDGYLFHSENFNLPPATEYQEISKDIALNNLKKDVKIILKNVFFETGSSNLRPASYAELGRLSKLLTDNPDLRIEISGHTDNQGNKTANLKLSEERAKSVVDFLITEGIASNRLEFKGYGFEQAIADNASEEGRALNRRVEFKVLSN